MLHFIEHMHTILQRNHFKVTNKHACGQKSTFQYVTSDNWSRYLLFTCNIGYLSLFTHNISVFKCSLLKYGSLFTCMLIWYNELILHSTLGDRKCNKLALDLNVPWGEKTYHYSHTTYHYSHATFIFLLSFIIFTFVLLH